MCVCAWKQNRLFNIACWNDGLGEWLQRSWMNLVFNLKVNYHINTLSLQGFILEISINNTSITALPRLSPVAPPIFWQKKQSTFRFFVGTKHTQVITQKENIPTSRGCSWPFCVIGVLFVGLHVWLFFFSLVDVWNLLWYCWRNLHHMGFINPS